MKKAFLSLMLMLAVISASAKESESDQIIVRLGTENQLFPLYLARFVDQNSGIDAAYLKQLEEVLRFDLSHNGMTIALPNSSERDRLAHNMSSGERTNKWDDVYYVIRTEINSEKIPSVSMLAVNGDGAKGVTGKALTGDLAKDRRHMHQIADAIYKALFGAEGIATTHILYSVKRQAGEKAVSDIWEADYDGANAHPVVRDGGYNITPTYIPPKAGHIPGSFFYVAYKTAQPKIYMATLKEGQGRRFSYLRGNQLMPTISRQRNQVAFICDVTGNPDLFLQPFSVEAGALGKPRQIFSGRKATQGTPTFSPDGTRIAFVTNKDGSPKIYAMTIPPEGTPLKDLRPQLISKHTRESSAPAWSPDGSKLAYCGKVNGERQIWVYDFSTREERQLTQGSGTKENPTWAPNSLCLMYNTSDLGHSELYIVSVNQPQPIKISSGAGEKRFPSWEPR